MKIAAAILVALSAAASIGASIATGATPDAKAPDIVFTTAEKRALQAQINERLGDYGGGAQTGINEITYDNGLLILTIPLPGERKARAVNESATPLGVANCPYEFACLWSDTNFNGDRLARAACTTITLAAPFNSSTGSIHNNQTPGTQTLLLNSSRQILNANFPGSRINDTGVGSRWYARYWRVCP